MAYQVPQKTTINRFGIFTDTKCGSVLMHRLGGLKTTYSIRNAGPCDNNRSITQIWIDTRWNQQQLETWLDKSKSINHSGVWTREENQTIAA